MNHVYLYMVWIINVPFEKCTECRCGLGCPHSIAAEWHTIVRLWPSNGQSRAFTSCVACVSDLILSFIVYRIFDVMRCYRIGARMKSTFLSNLRCWFQRLEHSSTCRESLYRNSGITKPFFLQCIDSVSLCQAQHGRMHFVLDTQRASMHTLRSTATKRTDLN